MNKQLKQTKTHRHGQICWLTRKRGVGVVQGKGGHIYGDRKWFDFRGGHTVQYTDDGS